MKSLKKNGVDISHATIYMPVSYTLLEETLRQIAPGSKKKFIDIGCGKGRALCVAAHFGFTDVTGIDFSAAFCNAAVANLSITKKQFPSLNFIVQHLDASTFAIPKDADCIFLFNPFDEEIMQKVVNNIAISLKAYPRTLNVIYANPLFKEMFLKINFKEVYYSKKLRQLEVSILNCR